MILLETFEFVTHAHTYNFYLVFISCRYCAVNPVTSFFQKHSKWWSFESPKDDHLFHAHMYHIWYGFFVYIVLQIPFLKCHLDSALLLSSVITPSIPACLPDWLTDSFCVYICIYIHIHIIYIYIFMDACVLTDWLTYWIFFVCVYICIYICAHIYVYIYVYMYIYIYICIYIHIYIYIYIYGCMCLFYRCMFALIMNISIHTQQHT